MKRCVVCGSVETGRRHGEVFVSYHEAPCDDALRERWRRVINQHSNTPIEVTVYSRVCSKHFLPSDYKDSVRRVLKKGAFPSVFQCETVRVSQRRRKAENVKPQMGFYSTTKCTKKECANGHVKLVTVRESTGDIQKNQATVHVEVISTDTLSDTGAHCTVDDVHTSPPASEEREPKVKAAGTDDLKAVVHKDHVVPRTGRPIVIPVHAVLQRNGREVSNKAVQTDIQMRHALEVFRWKRRYAELRRENMRLRKVMRYYKEQLHKLGSDTGSQTLHV